MYLQTFVRKILTEICQNYCDCPQNFSAGLCRGNTIYE